MHNLSLILSTATAAARTAGEIVMGLRAGAAVSNKSATELVTEADVKAQAAIVDAIHAAFPDDQILGEEGLTKTDRDAPHLWIVDPLDGTNNYVHGIPHYSVSIAYAEGGETLCGVVLDVCRDELFTATKDGPALLNGKPVRVSPRADLFGAMIASGFYYDRGPAIAATLRSINALFDAGIGDIRRSGSAALDLCWVACGRLDAHFEYRLSPWDFAAGMLICRRAGGACTDVNGNCASLHSRGIVASNGRLHEAALKIMRRNSPDMSL